jgi:GDPmannose 4,6-dehydratase
MWLMLQRPEPEDFVVATGVAHSVRDLCVVAFEHVGLDHENHVVIDPAFIRPAEVDHLLGDASRAHAELGWKVEVDFQHMIRMMVDADIDRIQAVTARRAAAVAD